MVALWSSAVTPVPIGITCLLAHVYFLSMSAEMSGWESAVLVPTWKEQTCFGTLVGQLTQSQVTTGCALSLTLLPSQVLSLDSYRWNWHRGK